MPGRRDRPACGTAAQSMQSPEGDPRRKSLPLGDCLADDSEAVDNGVLRFLVRAELLLAEEDVDKVHGLSGVAVLGTFTHGAASWQSRCFPCAMPSLHSPPCPKARSTSRPRRRPPAPKTWRSSPPSTPRRAALQLLTTSLAPWSGATRNEGSPP